MTNWVSRVMQEKTPDRPMVLFFDYDSTLAPPASHPRDAVMPAATHESLAIIAGAPDVTLTVVSGRAMSAVKSLVGLPGVWYAGSGGMHIDLGGEERIDPGIAAFEPMVDALMEALAGPLKWFPGAWIERKPGSLSLHHGYLQPLMATCFVEEVRDVLKALEPTCPRLLVRCVSQTVEIAPADSWTKGDAVLWMLARCPADAFCVLACDGAIDWEVVAMVNARSGITIGIGPDAPSGVAVRLADPCDLAEDLSALARLLSTPTPHVVNRACA